MRFISHVGRVDIMVDFNHCVSCHEVIPFGMSKCSKCRSEETFARKKSRAKYDKCSDCGAPIPLGDRRHGVRCLHCQKKRDMRKEKELRGGRAKKVKEARELKSRW